MTGDGLAKVLLQLRLAQFFPKETRCLEFPRAPLKVFVTDPTFEAVLAVHPKGFNPPFMEYSAVVDGYNITTQITERDYTERGRPKEIECEFQPVSA